jgi:hypothetical protein
MSRARERNTVHVVADTLDQAVEELARDWAAERRARWAIDSGTPATEPLAVEQHPDAPSGQRAALRHARLEAERRAVAAAIPPDHSAELADVDRRISELRRDRNDLLTGHGRYVSTPEGTAARELIDARRRHHDAQHYADISTNWRDRRHWRKEAAGRAGEEAAATTAYQQTVGPEAQSLDHQVSDLEAHRDELHNSRRERTAWLAQHPEAARRLHTIDSELHPLPDLPEIHQALGRARGTAHERDLGVAPPAADHGIDLGR